MTTQKLSCEVGDCPFDGETTERRGVLAGMLMKIIAAVMVVLLGVLSWIGQKAVAKVETMTTSFDTMNLNVARMLERESASNRISERNEMRLTAVEARATALEKDVAIHSAEDQRRYASFRFKPSYPQTEPKADAERH